ncbi:DUF2975 domain-containing protein [Tenacibaculum amylolyticum]|uniref:DUF2975 domain-containing protein n=1 Tax=Tenacibaculum amylolyticum TaxID=104269 RepID=UPI00389587E2
MKKIAFQLSKLFYYGFALFSAFVTIFSMLSFIEYYLDWDIPLVSILDKESDPYVNIRIPLLQLTVGFSLSIKVILMWLSLFFYTIYFWALKNFFGVFIQEQVFNKTSQQKLRVFFKLNFIPIFVGLISIIVGLTKSNKIIFSEEHLPLIIHLLIAFMVYFYMDLMQKGRKIQEENDLTI